MYDRLEDVPVEIREFYEEVPVFENVWNEEEEEFNKVQTSILIQLIPIDIVKYEDVAQAISFRWVRGLVNDKLTAAIRYDYFYTNHDLYLLWVAEYEKWVAEQPTTTNIEGEEEVLPSPVRPVVTPISKWRELYEELHTPTTSDFVVPTGEFTYTYDDDNYIVYKAEVTVAMSEIEIAEVTLPAAISTRYDKVYSVLPLTLESGVITSMDMGKGRDGVLGIDNVKDAIMAHDAGMELTDEVYWIMSDNSVEIVTLTDLSNVVIAFNVRKQQIFHSYATWRAGDIQEFYI